MSYLEQLLSSSSGIQQRNARRKGTINDLLTAVAPSPSRVATPAAGGGGQHSMGDGHGHDSQGEVNGLNAEFNNNLQRLIAASGGKVKIGSGYRSLAQQQILYDRYIKGDPRQKAPAAAPGKSNHNHGLAADLQYADEATRKWVHANAGAYGMRFPMSYEPWHIEPINAKAIRSGKK